ncbi:MAG TPA: hypothetical protein VF725_00730 [Ktedonobacterales bacterium]
MDETERAPAGEGSPVRVAYSDGPWAPGPPWVDRTLHVMLRFYWIVFFILIPAYGIMIFVPAIGSRPILFGMTARIMLKALLYTIFAVGLLLSFGPFYWRACRTPPRAWWQWVFPLGVLLLVVGLGTLAVTLLLNPQLEHSTDPPPIIVVVAIVVVIGLIAFAVGDIGLTRAVLRQWREARAIGRPRSDVR